MTQIGLITYDKAVQEMRSLENYIKLVENYEIDNIEKFIIKNYALTNSSSGVIKAFNIYNSELIHPPISRDYILQVIKSTPKDELHKIIRSGYIKKFNR